MDEKPFLEFNITSIKPNTLVELKKFHKTYFNIPDILSSASELKYTGELMAILKKEFSNPSQDFVRVLAKQVYDGVCTQRIIEEFTELTKKSITTLISEMISERLENALKTETQQNQESITVSKEPINEESPTLPERGDIITTEEEIDGYNIVKAILYEDVDDILRIVHRDTKSYFGVLFDDNNRKPICRLHLNSETHKYISTFNQNREEVKTRIDTVADIYKFSKDIKATALYYMNEDK